MTFYTEKCTQCNTATSTGIVDALTRFLRRRAVALRLRASIARERRQLRELPAELLRDIGVSRGDADRESRRSDIPRARAGS